MKLFNFSKKRPEKVAAEDESYIADSKAALLDKTLPWANRILYTVLLFVFIGLIWAAIAEVDDITVGEGRVIPSTQNKTIQSLDGGTIQEILVQQGDLVQKGDILLYLDDTRYKADYRKEEERYLALLALVARLTAEANHKNKITFPKALDPYPGLIARETQLFNTRKQALEEALELFEKNYKLAQKEVNIMEPLVKKGYAAKIDLIRAQRVVNDLLNKMADTKSRFYENTMKDLNTHQAELASSQEALTTLRDKMQRTTIRSPVKGIVKKIDVNTVGGVISPAMDIMEIVPLDDNLLVEAKISPVDIAFIHPGQKASIKVTAYDYTIYGALEGHVTNISADAIENEKACQGAQNTSFYHVKVLSKKTYLGSERHKLPIIPGMMVTVHIITGKKTVLTYLLKPLIKAKTEALRER